MLLKKKLKLFTTLFTKFIGFLFCLTDIMTYVLDVINNFVHRYTSR